MRRHDSTAETLPDEEVPADFAPVITRLRKDLRAAAANLTAEEARYLVDLYYQLQHFRIASANQVRSGEREPNAFLTFTADAMHALEKNVARAMDVYTDGQVVSRWAKSVYGIGPILAAGLIAHIDITRAKTAGAIWRFCFPAGTRITTPDGLVAIEELRAGDAVVAADGSATTVVQPFRRSYEGEVVHLKARGMLPLDLTPEHPVLVREGSRVRWVEAGQVEAGSMSILLPRRVLGEAGLLAFTPSPKASGKQPLLALPVTIDDAFAWFAGYYAGDGSSTVYDEGGSPRGQCNITFALDDPAEVIERCREVAARFGHTHMADTGRAQQLVFGRLTVARAFRDWFGGKAESKRVPGPLFSDARPSIRAAFLRGLLESDGHIVRAGRSAGTGSITSASVTLMLQAQEMLASLGIFAPLHRQLRSDPTYVIEGHSGPQRPERYVLSLRPSDVARLYGRAAEESTFTNRRPDEDEAGFWTPVVGTERIPFVGEVFNVETVAQSYVAHNVAVHNCGLDPSVEWKKGQKRPYNAACKVLCWKIGTSFWKFHNRPDCFYGKLMEERKAREVARNERGDCAEAAAATLATKNIRDKATRDKYEAGRLPDGRVHLRAQRWVVKLFLSHWWQVAREAAGLPVGKPYVITYMDHVHEIVPPGWPMPK